MHDISEYSTGFLDIFTRIARMERASDKKQKGVRSPTTDGQTALALLLRDLMSQMGLEDVKLTDKGYLTATLPGNTGGSDTMGLLAHLDTANRNEAGTVNPQMFLYTGGDIVLRNGLVIEASKRPYLAQAIGDLLVITDGESLLGADDGAGIAEILTACQFLLDHPEIERRNLRIGFFPDEEIGMQAVDLDIQEFGADYAFTVDGPGGNEIVCETFNAWTAHLKIKGVQCFPGDAKALGMTQTYQVLWRILRALEEALEILPQFREGREPYIMPTDGEGDEKVFRQDIILRAFTVEEIESLKQCLQDTCASVVALFPGTSCEITYEFGYSNMQEDLKDCDWIVKTVCDAMIQAGIEEPALRPARGGTDGCALSKRKLPCPDIAAGYHDQHGPLEHLVVGEAMRIILTLINLIQI